MVVVSGTQLVMVVVSGTQLVSDLHVPPLIGCHSIVDRQLFESIERSKTTEQNAQIQ